MLPVTYLFMLPAVFGFKPPHEKNNFRLERGQVSTAALRPDVFVKQSGKADPGISKSKYVALDAHPQDKDSVYFGVRDKKLDELRAEIQDLMKEHPLIEETHSIAALKDKILLPDGDEGSLFLGTGLCTTKEMSKALPFDAVAYLVLAEKMRRQLGLQKTVHVIADTGAKSNSFVDPEEADKFAGQIREMINTFTEQHGMKDVYKVIKCSEFDDSPEYKELLDAYTGDEHDYVKKQMADMEFFRRTEKASAKLSWLVDPKKDPKFDERFFDEKYSEKYGDNYSFIYTHPGRTFDSKRPNVCPYSSPNGEKRILITPDEDVEGKLKQYEAAATSKSSKTTLRGTLKHLEDIVKSYEELFGAIPDDQTLGAKIKHINAKFFRANTVTSR